MITFKEIIMKTKIITIDGVPGIIIPDEIAEKHGFKIGGRVELEETEKQGRFTIEIKPVN